MVSPELFHSLFTTTEKYDYGRVKNFFKYEPVDIARLQVLLVPIVYAGHYVLVSMCKATRTITLFDSARTSDWKGDRKAFATYVRYWIADEVRTNHKKCTDMADIEEWTIIPNSPLASQQTDGHTCGAFTCAHAAAIAEGKSTLLTNPDGDLLRSRLALTVLASGDSSQTGKIEADLPRAGSNAVPVPSASHTNCVDEVTDADVTESPSPRIIPTAAVVACAPTAAAELAVVALAAATVTADDTIIPAVVSSAVASASGASETPAVVADAPTLPSDHSEGDKSEDSDEDYVPSDADSSKNQLQDQALDQEEEIKKQEMREKKLTENKVIKADDVPPPAPPPKHNRKVTTNRANFYREQRIARMNEGREGWME